MKIGIIGHAGEKFNGLTETKAKLLIEEILTEAILKEEDEGRRPLDIFVVSGRSPMGGIDVWAEELGPYLGCALDIKAPTENRWDAPYGFKARNLDIASDSDILHVIVVAKLPEGYKGMNFKSCYHCGTNDHVKSGACWTAKQARKLGKEVVYHIIDES